ncbi:hypothetical protein R3P38DRAFT_2786658 [Favolaschia claudopus]|uniref:Uncharacterized protein n=1 Tax=Favolaschia claudopus TaxID=2862362 RepID=A0AAW0ARY7_9AGAR
MPLKKLRNLANLNKHSPNAFSNTAKTLKRKWKAANGKENCRITISSTSRVSDISTEPPLPSPPSEPANNAPDTHLDSMSDTPSAENLEGRITDPREVDVPEGEAEAYSEPPAPSDDEGEPETNVQGTPWDDRKPPTQVMDLEAYEAIQLLLFIPSVPGKRSADILSRSLLISAFTPTKIQKPADSGLNPLFRLL